MASAPIRIMSNYDAMEQEPSIQNYYAVSEDQEVQVKSKTDKIAMSHELELE